MTSPVTPDIPKDALDLAATELARRHALADRPPSSIPSWFEIAAGTLDTDPEIRPDKHIFVEFVPAWSEISDDLPRLDKRALVKLRMAQHSKGE